MLFRSYVHVVEEKDFDAFISEGLVAVDFYANWCGPCRVFAPIVEKAAKQLQGVVKVGKLNVDSAGTVAREYKVKTIPTIVLFYNGEEIARKVGRCSVEELKAFLTQD